MKLQFVNCHFFFFFWYITYEAWSSLIGVKGIYSSETIYMINSTHSHHTKLSKISNPLKNDLTSSGISKTRKQSSLQTISGKILFREFFSIGLHFSPSPSHRFQMDRCPLSGVNPFCPMCFVSRKCHLKEKKRQCTRQWWIYFHGSGGKRSSGSSIWFSVVCGLL